MHGGRLRWLVRDLQLRGQFRGLESANANDVGWRIPLPKPAFAASESMTGVPRTSGDCARPCGLYVVRLRADALPAPRVDPRRSLALTGTCPGTLPLSANAAGVERP